MRQKGLPKLIALIFADWTFRTLGSNGKSNMESISPHLIQVASILRMLGCDVEPGYFSWINCKNTIVNHFIEIGTGEGKSIILGVVSIILALFGNQVDCVCYSQYLSNRDCASFQQMFTDFDVQHKIAYYTFNELAEKLLN